MSTIEFSLTTISPPLNFLNIFKFIDCVTIRPLRKGLPEMKNEKEMKRPFIKILGLFVVLVAAGLIITSIGAHSSIKAMAKVADVDILLVNTEEKLTGESLRETIDSLTIQERKRLFCVVATGGTTNAGIIDELSEIATVCENESLWFHVDAAYGGGALVADSVRHLFKGIERADSVTIDPHKWMFSPYDCGAVIYKNPELAKDAHSQQGSYLDIFKDNSKIVKGRGDYGSFEIEALPYETQFSPIQDIEILDINNDGRLDNPNDSWAGITRQLTSTDLEQANVEYIEFWLQDPFQDNPTNPGGKLVFNLGNISEDIIKDGRKLYENGLPQDGDKSLLPQTAWGTVVPQNQSLIYAFDTTGQERINQDVGYDGYNDSEEIAAFGAGFGDDPAKDNYTYFLNTEGNIFERYKKFNGVARIAFNRPNVRNAFRPKTTSELYDAFYDANEDTSIGGVPIQKGTLIECNWLNQFFHPEVYENPLEFKP